MKHLAIILAAMAAVWAVSSSYRTYRARTESQLAEQRMVAEARDEENHQRATAEEEARRLAKLKAEQEAATAQRAIEELRAQQLAAESQRMARETEAARWESQLQQLRQQKAAAASDAKRAAEDRAADLARIEAAQSDATAKLRSLQEVKAEQRDRASARAAALEHQMELEKRAQEQLSRYRENPSR